MKILWVATKLPWPPVDGGRLLMVRSFQALAAAGHPPTVVAPDGGNAAAADEARRTLAPWARLEAVAARPRGKARALLGSLLGGPPWTLGRHALPAVAARVGELAGGFDGILAEQLQALGSIPTNLGVPVVWRAQNVESDLWSATARRRQPPIGWLLGREARRLERHEGRAAAGATAVVCLTREDRDRLEEMARQHGGGPLENAATLEVRPTPFPESLDPAEEGLPGEPAVVVLGSAGWWPNQEGLDWFARAVAPDLSRRAPGARVHAFGQPPSQPVADRRWVQHPAPDDSRQVFARGSILAVPLFVASGVRMKILEAWARGVPVVATSVAARGLAAEPGRELLVADHASDFAAALERLGRSPSLADELVAAGRDHLRRLHRSEDFAEGLLALFRQIRRS